MRRSRFAQAIESSSRTGERASIGEALWVDVRLPDSSDEESLAMWRVAGFDHAPLLLGATHVLILVASLAFHLRTALDPSVANPVVWIGLILMLDVAAGIVILKRRAWQ